MLLLIIHVYLDQQRLHLYAHVLKGSNQITQFVFLIVEMEEWLEMKHAMIGDMEVAIQFAKESIKIGLVQEEAQLLKHIVHANLDIHEKVNYAFQFVEMDLLMEMKSVMTRI